MCFVKTPSIDAASQAPSEPVERHKADAEVTKNSKNENTQRGYLQNIKTSPVGLEDYTGTEKKTLLGE